MIKVTTTAAKQIVETSKQSGSEGMSLRIAGKIKPDGTYEYGMGFDEAKDGDVKITSEGINIIVAPICREMLEDTVLDFVEIEPGKLEFTFFNPNDPDHKTPKDT